MLALFVVLAMVAIGAGFIIAWYTGNRGGAPLVTPSETIHIQQPEVEPPVTTPARNPVRTAPPQPPERGRTNPAPEVDSRPWDQKLDDILLGVTAPSVNEKADAIRKLMTVAPEEAQPELAQHLINMAQDDHYDGVAELLTNATTQTGVATVLMNDLLNRRNDLKLPMLLAIARNDDHPLKDQAKDMLELFLQADYGTNWDQWASAVDAWLQDNQ